jgi:very-short-patch-repair endonuclease
MDSLKHFLKRDVFMKEGSQSFYEWCIANNKQHLLDEWDYVKNTIHSPNDISYGSTKKIWWKCEKGHSYDAQTNNRRNGSGCPYCKHQKFKTGYNDLLTIYPEVAQFWNYKKNVLTPDKVLAGGHKKVWWICEKGHEWESTINSKIADHHCPYCSGRQVIKGETDLDTLYPELAEEWNYEKNKEKKPSDVSAKSSTKVWWKCKKCGYEWRALVSNRTRDNGETGSGCPQCSNELRISFPEKTVYFYLKRNFKNILENIDNSYFHWLGKMSIDVYIPELKLGIEYDGAWHKKKTDLNKNKLCHDNGVTLLRIRDNRLPMLNDTSIDYSVENRNEKNLESAIKFIFDFIKKRFNLEFELKIDIQTDRISIYELMDMRTKENSLLQSNTLLSLEWNYEKNGGLQPSVVSANSHKKVWWRCNKGHEWRATIASRNGGGNGCPVCANKKPQRRHGSLEGEHPELLIIWHPTKNFPLTPEKVTLGTRKLIYWRCTECRHEWKGTPYYQLRIGDCPSCLKREKARNRVTNILLTDGIIDKPYISLEREWHTTKNNNFLLYEPTLDSYEIKYWWQCHDCHYEWQTTIAKRALRGQGCPACRGKNKVIVGYNDLLTTNPQLAKDWHPNKNLDMKPTEVTKGSNKKVWWLCSVCRHEWDAVVKYRNKGRGCPQCARKRRNLVNKGRY